MLYCHERVGMRKVIELKKGERWYIVNYDGTENDVLMLIAQEEFGSELGGSVFENNSPYSVLENLGWSITVHNSFAA